MAFTGTAVKKQVSDRAFRVTGLSFAGATTGTISVGTGAGEVDLGETDWADKGGVDILDRLKVTVIPVGAVTETQVTPNVTKSGTDITDALITINAVTAYPEMEIFVELLC